MLGRGVGWESGGLEGRGGDGRRGRKEEVGERRGVNCGLEGRGGGGSSSLDSLGSIQGLPRFTCKK